MADEVALSIEETNKLRISLGLKPLNTGKSVSQEQIAVDNFNKQKEQEKTKQKQDELKKRIERSKNKREAVQQLKGKGIADVDENAQDIDDVLSWVNKSRERQKQRQMAKKQQAAIEEQDKSYLDSEYTSSHLKGMEVAHRLDDIKEGEEEILILKDQTIAELEESGDMLQSGHLLEQKRRENNIRIQKHLKNVGTFGKDHDDLTSGINYLDNAYLNNDDDDQGNRFKLGENGSVAVNRQSRANSSAVDNFGDAVAMNLSVEQPKQADDYLTAQEASLLFKKKKKKQRSLVNGGETNTNFSIGLANDDENGVAVGSSEVSKRVKVKKKSKSRNTAESRKRDSKLFDSWDESLQLKNEQIQTDQFKTFFEQTSTQSFVDDDDLQQAVALTRKKKLEYKLPTITEAKVEGTYRLDDDYGEGAIVLSTTTEFAQKVGNTTEEWMNPFEKNRTDTNKSSENVTKSGKYNDQYEDVEFDDKLEQSSAENQLNRDSHVELDAEMEEINASDQNQLTKDKNKDVGEIELTKKNEEEEEPLVRSGVGSALKLLLKKGLIAKPDEEQQRVDKEKQKRQQWLIDSKKRELLRNQEIDSIKRQRRLDSANSSQKTSKKAKVGGSSSQSTLSNEKRSEAMDQELQRLQDSERLEREYLRKHEESMADYKPSFSLKYTDDSGRELNQKEAFKQFAHQFHGIFPGKKKTDKLREKIEREKQLEAVATTEQTVKMGEAWNNNMKKQNNAYVVLTTGNKLGLDSVKLNKKP